VKFNILQKKKCFTSPSTNIDNSQDNIDRYFEAIKEYVTVDCKADFQVKHFMTLKALLISFFSCAFLFSLLLFWWFVYLFLP
jgi:hypothetical protein